MATPTQPGETHRHHSTVGSPPATHRGSIPGALGTGAPRVSAGLYRACWHLARPAAAAASRCPGREALRQGNALQGVILHFAFRCPVCLSDPRLAVRPATTAGPAAGDHRPAPDDPAR